MRELSNFEVNDGVVIIKDEKRIVLFTELWNPDFNTYYSLNCNYLTY